MIETGIRINRLDLKRRLVMPPMATRRSLDGLINENLIEYYAGRSKNSHLGLIITEHSYVGAMGKASAGQVAVDDDECIDGLKQLTEAVHNGSDVKLFAQISHAGMVSNNNYEYLLSADEGEYKGKPVRSMNKEDIESVIESFAKAALRVKKAGFDGVEIHGAHGYLLNQFYSPLTNHRKDEYGPQSVENRVHLMVDVIRKVRTTVGEDFPISMRFGALDDKEEGSSIDDAKVAARLLEDAGADVISVSGGVGGYMRKCEGAYFADVSEEIKKSVNIPVLLTGGIKTLEYADELIKENKADLIGIGRALLANPYL